MHAYLETPHGERFTIDTTNDKLFLQWLTEYFPLIKSESPVIGGFWLVMAARTSEEAENFPHGFKRASWQINWQNLGRQLESLGKILKAVNEPDGETSDYSSLSEEAL